jgi:stage II sporulation protein D
MKKCLTIFKYSLVFLLVFFLLYSCGEEKPITRAAPLVRVLIGSGKIAEINTSDYVLIYNNRRELGSGRVFIKLSNNNIIVNEIPFPVNFPVEIAPVSFFELNGRKYRGNLVLYPTNQTIYFINVLDVESYLYGVVPSEIYPGWHKETIKAQSVVARTYVLYELTFSKNKGKIFDVYDDTRSQVYKGISGEVESVRNIINETFGEVLRYEGRIIRAFFHSASGGMTESSKEYFGVEWPYLVSVSSKFSETYPENKWEYSIEKNRFAKAFGLNDISSIKILERTSSKRIKKLALIDSEGVTNFFDGKELRAKLGETNVKSLRCNVILTNDRVLIWGYGYGHGVGFAQWDAQGMALEGNDYRSILMYFFPGCKIEKVW